MTEQKKRGFSSMEKTRQREIASKGGKAAHQKGTAHEFTSDEAKLAGRKGGVSSRARRQQKPENASAEHDAMDVQEIPDGQAGSGTASTPAVSSLQPSQN